MKIRDPKKDMSSNIIIDKEIDIHSSNFIKKGIRRFIYPIFNFVNNLIIRYKIPHLKKFHADLILTSQRGNDYERHRRRLNSYKKINNSIILIVGVGTGRDIKSWVKYNPKKIIAIDIINYKKIWDYWKNYYQSNYNIEIEFIQTSVTDLSFIKSNSIDIISSDAVFEHIKDFDKALNELYRVLKNRGFLYSTFGPLWYSWGGDHVSGVNDINNGYNHLLMNDREYKNYLSSFGNYSHDPDDGRTWVFNNLFSYLKPIEYIEKIEYLNFKKHFVQLILDKRSFIYRNNNKEFKKLSDKIGLENLIISGMSIIYEK